MKDLAVDLDSKYLDLFSTPGRHYCGPIEAEHTKSYQNHFVTSPLPTTYDEHPRHFYMVVPPAFVTQYYSS